ncbi:MAG: RraA family protein [Sciscionella sp.]
MDATFEHETAVPPIFVQDIPAVDDKWIECFATVSSCDVADAAGRLYTMEGIVPLYRPISRLVARAFTVKAWPGDGLAVHGAASMAGEGDVLVIDARGYAGVTGGGYNMLAGPRTRGLRGVVIDGAFRDVDDFQQEGFPIFGRSRSTHASTKRRPGEINVAVACGGVVVHAGDLVVADGEGVAVVPNAFLGEVWSALETNSRRPAPDPDAVLAGDRKRRENFDRAFAAANGRVLADSAPDKSVRGTG